MNQQQIVKDVHEINKRVCFNLWNVANVNSKLNSLSPHLIFPQKRSGKIRISEQEARVLYCSVLNNLNYFYSMETPTKNVYQQKGQTPVSASTDLSMFINSGNAFEKVVNVEFKAHNPKVEDIRKDIEKLIRENIYGNWFHTLKNIGNKTIPTLFDKFKDSFQKCSKNITKKVSFVFCFCVLEKKWACTKEFSFDPSHDDLSAYINDFFDLKYSATAKSASVKINKLKGWTLVGKRPENNTQTI
ncbi:MAG: hypothetical protein P9M13_10365 [Candidatus Ancaeobacter aquaticus]|nr:hypothetical protein [Candidatus Ancaeobacter aquaticus]